MYFIKRPKNSLSKCGEVHSQIHLRTKTANIFFWFSSHTKFLCVDTFECVNVKFTRKKKKSMIHSFGRFCNLAMTYVNQTNKSYFALSFYWRIFIGLVLISSLMIISAMAMFAFPKQLRGNRIPSPHQVATIETEKPAARVIQEEEVKPHIRGTFSSSILHSCR